MVSGSDASPPQTSSANEPPGPRGIARWSRLLFPLLAVSLSGCESTDFGIRILLVNGANEQFTVFVESDNDMAEVLLNTGNVNLILDGDVGEQVRVAFRDGTALVASITCTSTGAIVGADDPGVEYGEIFIQDFNGPAVADCVSGWAESGM